MRTSFAFVLAVALAAGCVYPRRGTPLSAVGNVPPGSASAPADLVQLTVVDAQVRPRARGDRDWDDGGGLPDVVARIYRDEQLVWESPRLDDTLTPRWDATLPRNFRISPTNALRFELWDIDGVGADPIGIYRTRGLPENALPGAEARVMLEGGSYLAIRVDPPRPHRGVGIEEFEVRPDELLVLRVLPYSPASRAGIEAGDRVVAIGDVRVSGMTDAAAASALSMALSRAQPLIVRGANDRERTVTLEGTYVWLAM
ncbi:MAG: PDZ domain-containing protein [Sandaracinaceae bacterium]|nr:PDZ domain-containing protein [Sandaracinaceae bacterium]